VFFFQAEDGIRDLTVTGVQTCALPISSAAPTCARRRAAGPAVSDPPETPRTNRTARRRAEPPSRTAGHCLRGARARRDTRRSREIGRASCRERVESAVVAARVKDRDVV